MQIIIKRQKSPAEKPRIENYNYDDEKHISVLQLLEKINEDNVNKPFFEPIKYECSCEQGLCGACAMVVNKNPMLGCKAFLDNCVDKDDKILIEPLSKFMVVEDLIVDRSILLKTVSEMKIWLEKDSVKNKNLEKKQYLAAQCLFCGCCLEACPNYTNGDTFAGAVGALAMANDYGKVPMSDHKRKIKKEYFVHFFNDCSKVGACEKVCPSDIPTLSLISEANRESVWGIWNFFKK